MNMGTSSMAMGPTSTMAGGMTMTATGSAASATSSMSMSMGMGGGCKISMLWNWYTIDSCFIAKSWRVTSNGAFAGSCIGVVLLVILLEFLRRAGKEYDRFILRQHLSTLDTASPIRSSSPDNGKGPSSSTLHIASKFKPSILQQAIRAALHLFQFAVAYFVMLLAMYYNGYIIICIFIGAFIGSFIFSWEAIGLQGPKEEVTVCCG